MSASEIRATYDDLSTIARRFVQASEKHEQDLQRVQQASTRLHRQGWEGKGSDAFFREMERVVLPALRRLSTALAEGGRTVEKIQTVMRNAEEEAARLFQGQSSNGNSQPSGRGGGNGTFPTRNDIVSDEVTPAPIQNLGDAFSVVSTAVIAPLFGVNLAFPTVVSDDMPRFPDTAVFDPAKPQLRSATAEDSEAITQVYNELTTLKEYGVTLTQNGEAHWTPQEIHQIYVAVTEQGQAVYDRAVELKLIDPTKTTPADVFQAVYTNGENNLRFIRDMNDTHPSGAYAWKDNNTLTFFDTAYYAQQTTTKGAPKGFFFTPSILIQHEISHQIQGLYENNEIVQSKLGGLNPAEYYASQFDFVNTDADEDDDEMRYEFANPQTIYYVDENQQLAVYEATENEVISTSKFPTRGLWTDMGYSFRARTETDDAGYNADERVTDGHLAEILGPRGYALGANGQNAALWAAARNNVNTAILDAILVAVLKPPSS